jgi:dipeptidyl aminopeptidase/acylaminoacyl peptidase
VSKTTAPYGSWRSPVKARLLAEAGVRLGWLQVTGDNVYWVEGRPLEGGRYVVVRRRADGAIEDVTPPGFNARTTVHEYGGGMVAADGDTVFFCHFDDQRLYRQDPGAPPRPITPDPAVRRGLRYADMRLTPDGTHVICVRERHAADEAGPSQDIARLVQNELIILPADGSAEPRAIASGHDFYAAPRVSPDGTRLAWLCWDNPQMPWDGTELWVAEIDDSGTLRNEKRVAGGPAESIFQPEWSPQGTLHFVSDRTNWWNLYRVADDRVEPLAPMEAEFGGPLWVFGLSRYAFLPDRHIACIYSQDGIDHLGIIDPDSGRVAPIQCDYTALSSLQAAGNHLWAIGGGPTTGPTVFTLDLADGAVTPIRSALTVDLDPDYVSRPQPIEFPTEGGLTAHALFYPATNPDFAAPAAERPPLLVISHGGPTAATAAQLSLSIQYWTSRGFGVVDVNYGGSTGYGRDYRERLRGNWGVVDVMDCVNAARYLIDRGDADPDRTIVRGGSAGGYTTLRALTWQDFFAAGASYYGLAELETFVHDTHKFESRYLEALIGPYPERKDLYFERSPVNFMDRINCPVILFQGLEDKVVPPSQAEIMARALEAKKLPYAYLPFEGEQHGFRQAETITRCAEAELYFYGRVFGFQPADEIKPVEIASL